MAGKELPHQHLVQGCCLLRRRRSLQPAECRRAGQRLGSAYGRLQDQVIAQGVVVAHVRPSQAKAINALCQHAFQAVHHAGGAAFVAQCLGCCVTQAKAPVNLLEQQNAAVTDDVAAVERGLHHTSSHATKLDLAIGTLWHRQSSVVIGGEIPMSTGAATRLPTYSREISGLAVARACGHHTLSLEGGLERPVVKSRERV